MLAVLIDSWFQTFAVFWMLYTLFWVIPRCLNFICRCFNFIPTCLWRWNRQSVPKLQHIKFRWWGITQKKAYNSFNSVYRFLFVLVSSERCWNFCCFVNEKEAEYCWHSNWWTLCLYDYLFYSNSLLLTVTAIACLWIIQRFIWDCH